jgi:hypothetical protein
MEEERRRPKRKAGRTILVSSDWKDEINLEGTCNTHQTSNGARFVVFDTIDNARSAFKSLRDSGARVKYSYYKIFFRISDYNLKDVKYDELKEQVKDLLVKLGVDNILYFKFYTKNNEIIGSGDLTVDTKETLDLLISSNENSFGEGQVSFYRFKMKKNDTENIENQTNQSS